LRQDSWDDKDTGKKRSRVEVTATDVTFLDGPSGDSGNSGGSNGSNNATEKSAPAAKKTNKKSDDVVIDDIDDKPIDLSEIPF
jgi:single-strand DNA-binding protein